MHSLSYIDLSEVWETPVSAFRDVRSIDPMPYTLGAWLEGCKRPNERLQRYADICQQVRQAKDEATRKALKLTLPAVTVGARMNTRDKSAPDAEKIAAVTGFTQVDIDLKDNPHITDAAALRDAVARIAYVAFTALSASGRGVWALVKVAEPENMGAHFEQLDRDFKSVGIALDRSKGRNPSDLRIYSFDPDAVIKERFAVYARKFTAPPKRTPSRPMRRGPMSQASIFKGAETFATRKAGAFTVTQGNRHHYIDNLCYYLNRHGIPQHEAEAYINAHLMPLSEIRSNCITHSYKAHGNLFGTWRDAETLPPARISKQSPPTDRTDRTDTERGASAMATLMPVSPAMRSARPPMHTVPVEVTAATSGTFTAPVDTMPVTIDWAQLERPEPFELDPF
jgi:hypothetical protein